MNLIDIINQLKEEIELQNQKIEFITEKQMNIDQEFNSTQNTLNGLDKKINLNSTKIKSDLTNMLNANKKLTYEKIDAEVNEVNHKIDQFNNEIKADTKYEKERVEQKFNTVNQGVLNNQNDIANLFNQIKSIKI